MRKIFQCKKEAAEVMVRRIFIASVSVVLCSVWIFSAYGAGKNRLTFNFDNARKGVGTQFFIPMSNDDVIEAINSATPSDYEGVVDVVSGTEILYWLMSDTGKRMFNPMNIQPVVTKENGATSIGYGTLRMTFNVAKSLKAKSIHMQLLRPNNKQHEYRIVINGDVVLTGKPTGNTIGPLEFQPQIIKTIDISVTNPTESNPEKNEFCIVQINLFNVSEDGTKQDVESWNVTDKESLSNINNDTPLPLIEAVPSEASLFAVYESSDTDVFTVDNGILHPTGKGNAFLNIRMGDNHVFNHENVLASIPVTVNNVASSDDSLSIDGISYSIEYYDLQGCRLKSIDAPGIYIERSGGRSRKIITR